MSKSKGNVISPVEVSDKYGTDALRMSLIIGNTPGTDLNLDISKVNAYKKFSNKLWNISRFVLSSVNNENITRQPNLTEDDKKRLERLNEVVSSTTEKMEKYRFDLAAEELYHYVWHEFADVILEESKAVLEGVDEQAKLSTEWTLYEILTTSLKALHPFMPFVTETIWSRLPKKDIELLMVEEWPTTRN